MSKNVTGTVAAQLQTGIAGSQTLLQPTNLNG